MIRGEETQIVGQLGGGARRRGRQAIVLPGRTASGRCVEDGRIVWFATFMTGEVFGVLKEHSILGRLMAGDAPDEAAFARGLAYARAGRAACSGGCSARARSACSTSCRRAPSRPTCPGC